MSLHRTARALKTTSRQRNEASLCDGAHTSKNPTPTPCPGTLDMDEASLRKLTRAALQKLAKENKVKANMKSNLIIEELVKLCKVVPPCQDEENEEPARKKSRTSLPGRTPSQSPRQVRKESPPVAAPPTQIMDVPMDTSLDCAIVPEAPKSVLTAQNIAPPIATGDFADVAAENAGTSQSPSPILESHAVHNAPNGDDISDSGSDLSYASKNGLYNSPVSSRAGSPPLEEPMMLERAVKIMNQIVADDQRILAQIAALRERAATLREQAQKARDVVRAEQGRRVRLEAYFTYWREIAPEWPKEWIYEESKKDRSRIEQALRARTPPLPATGPAGSYTLSSARKDRDMDRLAARISLRRRQMEQQQETYKKGTGVAALPAEVDKPGECTNRLPSPQSSTSERVAKRKSRT